jgi:hypothetical protein
MIHAAAVGPIALGALFLGVGIGVWLAGRKGQRG